MSKFRIELTDNYTEWYEQASHHSSFTVFSDPDFLSVIPEEKVYGYIKKRNEKMAYFSITLKGGICKRSGFVIHNGIILSDSVFQLKLEKRNFDEFRINETFVNFLEENFKSIDLALHPYIRDIRPYLWLNYHSPDEKNKCRIYVRYTSYLKIGDLRRKNEFETIVFKGLSKGRKCNVREGRRKGVMTVIEPDVDLFLRFYEKMMANQGIKIENSSLELLGKIISNLVLKDKARIFVSYYKGKPIYATVWGWDKHRSYYLYGAGNPDVDLGFKGTICCWDAILWLAKEKKIDVVDFEGVNSPQRGFFKLSFGGELLNYYWIKKGI